MIAQSSREAAEQAATARAEESLRSVVEREAAEARTAQALAQVEQAAAEAAEAHRLRVEAEDKAAQVAIDRQAIESSIRHNTELVETAIAERLAAERKAAALASELVALRASVVDVLREKGSKKSLAALHEAVDRPSELTTPAVAETIDSMEHTGTIPVISAFLAPAADTAPPGVSASQERWLKAELDKKAHDSRERDHARGAAQAPAGVAGPATTGAGTPAPRREAPSRSIGAVTVSEDGLLTTPDGLTFDLYDRATGIKVTAKPGARRWKVDLSNGSGHTTIDAKITDPEELTRELVRWRPDLG